MAHMSNPLATAEQLLQRNSYGSLPRDLQDAVFYATQCLTQAAGLLLQLPQSVTAQANVILARYWLADPMMSYEFSDVSAACIYTVAKLGPSPCPPRDVTNVYAYLLSPSSSLFRDSSKDADSGPPPNDPMSYYLSESDYYAFHQRILALEARVLYSLSFDTHVALPHALAITYLQALEFMGQQPAASAAQAEDEGGEGNIARRAVAYLNTALLSPQLLYLTHQPNALATASIYNAARDVGAKMPDCEWWEVFDVDREELGFLVVAMRSLPNWARKTKEDIPGWAEGALRRSMIKEELERRGLQAGNGDRTSEVDEEQEMMRRMDDRTTEMQV